MGIYFLNKSRSTYNYEVAISKPTKLVISTIGRAKSKKTTKIQSKVTGILIKIQKKEGDSVKEGEPLAIMDSRSEAELVEQEKAKLELKKITLLEKEMAYNRNKKLHQKKVISDETLEKSETDYLQLKQKIIELEAALKAAIKRSQDYTLYAPIDGIISKQELEVGQTLGPQKTLFEIVDPYVIEIEVDIDRYFVDYLKQGQKSILKKYNATEEPFKGSVVFVSPTVDKGTGLVSIRIASLQAQNLKPGQVIEAAIIVAEFEKAISIPRNALIKEKRGTYVELLLNKKIVRREISYLDWPSPKVIVLKGLAPGDKFITKKNSFFDLKNIEEEP